MEKRAKGPGCVYANIVPNTQRNIKLCSSSNLRGYIEAPRDQAVKFAAGTIPRFRMNRPGGTPKARLNIAEKAAGLA